MRGLLIAGLFVAPLVFVVGCGKKSAPAGAEPAGGEKGGGEETGRRGPWPPTEVSITEGGIAEIDKASKEKNAVVLVEFWSLATEPSPKLELVANTRGGDGQVRGQALAKDKVAWHGARKADYMGEKYDGYMYRVIMVNVDGPAKKDEVLKHLKEHDVRHVTNFSWKGDPAAAKERYGFNGKAPHQALFGRNGQRVWATGDPLETSLDSLIFMTLDK